MASRTLIWLRRPTSWVEIVAWAALAAFVVVTLGPALAGVGTFLNTGFLQDFAPWASTIKNPINTTNVFDSDTLDSAAPQVALLVRLAHEGVFAQWNPYLSGGTELAGLPDSGAYSPLSLPWWILPLTYAPGMVKLLEIVVVTVGMSLLLRRYGMPRASWPIAALVYSSSGFMVAWTNWPQTRVAAFIPLLFWAIDRAAVEVKARDIIGVGAALACMLLGGFPAVVGYTMLVAAIYFVVRTVVAHRELRGVLGSIGVVVGGLVFGVLLSAWQLVPFAYNALHVIDFGVRKQSGGANALGIRTLVSAWVDSITNAGSTGARWSGGNPVETYSYVGIAAVVLIAAAMLVRSRRAPDDRRLSGVVPLLVALLGLSVVLIYLGGPILAAVRELPVFDSNPIGRMRCVVEFLAASTAGIGFGKLLEPELLRDEFARLRRGRPLYWFGRIIVAVFVLFCAAWVVYQTRVSLYPVPAAYIHQVKIDTLVAGLTAIAVAIAVGLTWLFRSRWLMVIAGIGIAVLVAAPAIGSVRTWWPTAPTKTFYPTTSAMRYLQRHVTDQERFATSGQVSLPGTASYYQVRSLTGHTFQTAEWKQLMTAIDPAAEVTPTYSTLAVANLPKSITSPLMDRLGVRYVISDPGYPLAGRTEAGPAATSVASVASGSQPLRSASYSGAVHGMQITGPTVVTGSTKGLTLKVAVVADASGRTITSTTTWVGTLLGTRTVAVKGDDIPRSESWHFVITVSGQDAGQPVDIGTLANGDAAVNLVRPITGQGVRVVHTGDATILERTTADDRVHWASSQRVLTGSSARVQALSDPATPDEQVVLSAPTTHRAGGGSARISLQRTDVNATKAVVDATTGGWVVVEDSLQRPGWSATIDGKRTELVAADNAGGAVWVPAGKHTVELRYSTPGLKAGIVMTIVSIVVAAIVAASVIVLGRRRRRRRDPIG